MQPLLIHAVCKAGSGASKPDAVLSPQPPSHDPSVSTGPLRGAAVFSLEGRASGQEPAADSPRRPAPKPAGKLLKAKPAAAPAKTGDPVRFPPWAAAKHAAEAPRASGPGSHHQPMMRALHTGPARHSWPARCSWPGHGRRGLAALTRLAAQGQGEGAACGSAGAGSRGCGGRGACCEGCGGGEGHAGPEWRGQPKVQGQAAQPCLQPEGRKQPRPTAAGAGCRNLRRACRALPRLPALDMAAAARLLCLLRSSRVGLPDAAWARARPVKLGVSAAVLKGSHKFYASVA